MRLPRVLIIMQSRVERDDSSNLLIRTLFSGWPTESLGQIYSWSQGSTEPLCGQTYAIGENDRRFGDLFQRLKRSGVAGSAYEGIRGKPGFRSRLSKSLLVDNGLYEVIFKLKISRELRDFVEKFKPEVIYAQGYSLGFTVLPRLIHEELGVPIVYQTTDDWPSYSGVGLFRQKIQKEARYLCKVAAVRYGFGQDMVDAYEERYQVPFKVSFHADSPDRFCPYRGSTGDPLRIVYSGSMYLGRAESLVQLVKAVEKLGKLTGRRILITAYVPRGQQQSELAQASNGLLEFQDQPSHEELPECMSTSDLLFLPESFSKEYFHQVHLSTSSKCHLYMFSRCPVLVFGPAWSGSVRYAQQEGWATVVCENNLEALTSALASSLLDEEHRASTVARGYQVALKNHLSGRIVEEFVETMSTFSSHG